MGPRGEELAAVERGAVGDDDGRRARLLAVALRWGEPAGRADRLPERAAVEDDTADLTEDRFDSGYEEAESIVHRDSVGSAASTRHQNRTNAPSSTPVPAPKVAIAPVGKGEDGRSGRPRRAGRRFQQYCAGNTESFLTAVDVLARWGILERAREAHVASWLPGASEAPAPPSRGHQRGR